MCGTILPMNPDNTSPRTPCPSLFVSSVSAGFPSPADDFMDTELNLNEYLVRHPAATFFVRVKGDSMTGAGIFPGSLLIIDRSLKARQDSIILAVLNGEFTVKRIRREGAGFVLYPENVDYQPVVITAAMDFMVWGIVVHVIRTFA